MSPSRVVVSAEEAIENIGRYTLEVGREPRLAARIRQHPAWYAIRAEDGAWLFGPSKYVGYHGMNARAYLAGYRRKDGRETEPALRAWFLQVDPLSPVGRELHAAFVKFAESHGKSPNANWRVSILPDAGGKTPERSRPELKNLSERIVFDPLVCGGRARIAGTRMRVADIVAMIADGATREEIIADFPYLKDEDITAALSWAARAVDHLVLRAA